MSKVFKFRLIVISLVILHFLTFLVIFDTKAVMDSIFYITIFEFIGFNIIFDLIVVFLVKQKGRKRIYLLIPLFYLICALLCYFKDFGNYAQRYCTSGFLPKVCYSVHSYAVFSVIYYFVFGFIFYHFYYFYFKKHPLSKCKKKCLREKILFVLVALIVVLLGCLLKGLFNYFI